MSIDEWRPLPKKNRLVGRLSIDGRYIEGAFADET